MLDLVGCKDDEGVLVQMSSQEVAKSVILFVEGEDGGVWDA